MPNTEAVVRELKRASESGMVLSQAIDFDQWQMLPSDVAKIRPADAWTSDVINHFHNPGDQIGGLLPWSKTHHNIRIRPGELSIWAGVNGHGKALALDTPIPTPSGWSTMGELQVGDRVFDEKGQPCSVIAATEVMVGRPCYRLTFSDGTQIVADANHQWMTSTAQVRHSERNAVLNDRLSGRPLKKCGSDQSWKRTLPGIKTTEEIARTVIVESGCWKGKVNHSVPVAGALRCLARILPIDPYILGAWLGGGTSNGASFTTADEEIVHQIAANSDYVITKHKSKYHYGITKGLQQQLRAQGLIANKHIPEPYLRASVAQRLGLLQGLMDTDGHITDYGRCEFTSINKMLAEQVHELVLSLGMQAKLITGRAKLNGRDCGAKYRVTFTPFIPVFRLRRKLERCKTGISIRIKSRFIVSCEKVESVPVRCIQVDSSSHLFLASRSMIPTHNSLVLSHVLIALMKQGHSACVASLEMRPVSTLTRMARQYVGNQEPSPEAIEKFTSFASDKLYLFDQQGTVESSKMLAVLRYAREHLGVQHFVIDSLMKCGLNADDYNAQKRFIDSLSSYARDSECHIHLVAHSRKRENEAGRMDKMDVKGTSEITDMADNVYTLWRNKTKEEKIREGKADDDLTNAPDAILTMDKQRHGEWEGIVPLWFHKRSLQFLGKNKNQAIDYMTGQVNVEEA